jgi:DnaJ-class molecular chaperone
MPIYKSDNQYGDLFIRFNIVIPKILDKSKLEIIKGIFDDSTGAELVTEGKVKEFSLENVNDSDLSSYDDSEDSEDSESLEESEIDELTKQLNDINSEESGSGSESESVEELED